MSVIAVTSTIVALAAGVLAWRKGLRQARYYVIAWAAFCIGTVVLALSKAGLVPSNMITDNAQQIGSVLEVLLISFALADRINFMKRQVEDQTLELEEKEPNPRKTGFGAAGGRQAEDQVLPERIARAPDAAHAHPEPPRGHGGRGSATGTTDG